MWEKNKGTIKCDKSAITCDVSIAQCDNGTVKCEEKIKILPNVRNVQSNVMLVLVIWDTSTHVDLMKIPKKHKTRCSSLDWWLFHIGFVVSIQVFTENFKIVNNLWIGFFCITC